MAPSRHLTQFWLINEAHWHLGEGCFIETVLDITKYLFENYIFDNTATYPRAQWVNRHNIDKKSTFSIYMELTLQVEYQLFIAVIGGSFGDDYLS